MVEPVSALGLGVSTPGRPIARALAGPDTITRMEPLPEQGSPVPRVHPLEIPVIWFGIQFIELAIIAPIVWAFIREDWPNIVTISISVAVLIGLTVLNYRVRRRFIP